MSITISKEEYREYQDAMQKLSLLESGGVDNWEFYGEALSDYTPISELYDEAEEFLQELAEGARVDYPAGREAGEQITFSEEAVEKIVELLKGQK